MNWLKSMNDVVAYIETMLTGNIDHQVMADMVGCSSYELSRIFSFLTGITLKEYIRKRRLSSAAFDIKNGEDKIIDIAWRYGYESQAAFSRAFKEVHQHTPLEVRKKDVNIKIYSKLSFTLSVKGHEEMIYRMVSKPSFQVLGLKGQSTGNPENGDTLDPLWRAFMDGYDAKISPLYKEPFWQVGVYEHEMIGEQTPCVIGGVWDGQLTIEGLTLVTIPSSIWAIFTVKGLRDNKVGTDEVYGRIYLEWMTASPYERCENAAHLEVFGPGDPMSEEYTWEIWIPVKQKTTF